MADFVLVLVLELVFVFELGLALVPLVVLGDDFWRLP